MVITGTSAHARVQYQREREYQGFIPHPRPLQLQLGQINITAMALDHNADLGLANLSNPLVGIAIIGIGAGVGLDLRSWKVKNVWRVGWCSNRLGQNRWYRCYIRS